MFFGATLMRLTQLKIVFSHLAMNNDLDRIFHALGDGTRRAIINFLDREGELTAGAIANRFSSAAPTVSKHLKVLEQAGLVSGRNEGRRRIYVNVAGALVPARDWMTRHTTLSEASLDRLAMHLNQYEADSL